MRRAHLLPPVVANRYVDGGVGSYSNPCYLAAFELGPVPELATPRRR